MGTSKVIKRYARALFNLARETDHLETVQRDLHGIQSLLAETPLFANFMEYPLIPTEQRIRILRELFGKKIHQITFNFLLLLEEKRRLGLLSSIADFFENLYYQLKGILKVQITVAASFPDAQIASIRDKLKSLLNKNIEPVIAENPAFIGGFKVKVADMIYDTSLSTQLETFRQKLISA
ncbi:MAG: ATP synthase F1 subunit delta [Kiritimatiellae bacterium]|nr:ATP synthase F1 subunit delta [Kiritimatiellia bacterium]